MQKSYSSENKESTSKEKYAFCLYVTGASPNSARAITNLKEICETYLKDRYTLEIVDVYQQGTIARKEQLVALPLLVKLSPHPRRRLIGDLSDTKKVLTILDLIV
ncbi:MAG TPA: circadian clock KaiB family protein [Flavipsychrobacter sp.]|nr:circadian clock KaiB family protein [Flavipsychrobacter sp.]